MSGPRWRVGHHLGRTVYLDDELVGLMDTPELGALVVQALNGTAQPITSREPEDKALEGIYRWYAAMDAEEDSDLPWPSGLSADNPNLTPAEPQPVVDRDALMQLLDDYAVGRYVPEDLAQHRAFMADAIERLLNGGAK